MKFKSLLIFLLLVTSIKAASVDDLTFTLNEDGTEYSVTSCDTSASGSLIIPSTFNDLAVTSLGNDVFIRCSSLTSVVVPEGISSIGDLAFFDCTDINTIQLPSTLSHIGSAAFYGCTSLASIQIPNNVSQIGNHAFAYCSALTEINIPSSLSSIGISLFYYCTNLNKVNLQDGSKTIGTNMFYKCSSLIELNIPSTVESIGGQAFRESGIRQIYIPDGITFINDKTFYNCDNLQFVFLPSSILAIGSEAFAWSENLVALFFTGDAPNIGSQAFNQTSAIIYRQHENSSWPENLSGTSTVGHNYPTILANTISERDARPTQADYDAVVADRNSRPTQAAYDAVVAERNARLTESEVRDLRLGSSMLEVVDGDASINIELEATDNLGITSPTWTPVPESKVIIHPNYQSGKIRIDVGADDASNSGTRFFRFKMTE